MKAILPPVALAWLALVTASAAAQGGCPRHPPLPLPRRASAAASAAALRQAPAIYRGVDLAGMRVARAVPAAHDRLRGSYAAKCGSAVRARSIVVYLRFPAMLPSTSLSEGVVLVARFARGMMVWAVLH